MNPSKTIYIWTFVVSIAFFIAGRLLFLKAFNFFEPSVDGIVFQIIEHNEVLKTSILFSLTVALMPLLVVLTWRHAHIISIDKKVASALIILIFVTIGIFARQQQVKIYFIKVVKPALLTSDKPSITYPIDPVVFVYYIFACLFIGCFVSYILFRKKHHNF